MAFSMIPSKRKRSDSTQYCIICDGTNNLVQVPKAESFNVLQRAAERRKDETTKKFNRFYQPLALKQDFSWHRQCYAVYTAEEKIRRREIALNNEMNRECNSIEPSPLIVTRTRPLSSRNLNFTKSMCIICGKDSYKQNRTKCDLSFRERANKLLSHARTRLDDVYTRLCVFNSVESILAQKFKYHKNCMEIYLYVPKTSNNPGAQLSVNASEETINNAFEMLLQEIEINFHQSMAFELSFLTERFNSFLNNSELAVNNKVTKDLLIKKYGEKIYFSHPTDRSKSATVIMLNVSMQDLVERIRELSDKKKNLRQFAEQLRDEASSNVRDDYCNSGLVCDENLVDGSLQNLKLPPTWNDLFRALFSKDNKPLSPTNETRAKSIFMDMRYFINKTHTAKHIALAQSIHHLTRSKHIIKILFKLGHCISYDNLLKLDELLIKKMIYEQKSNNLRTPTNILADSSLFLHGAIDNNDFLEETLSGKNTTHVTAMVLYQEHSNKTEICRNLVREDKLADIDIKCLSLPSLDHFVVTNNKPIISSFVDIDRLDVSVTHDIELVWILSKLKILNHNTIVRKNEKVVPSWSPFHQMLSDDSKPISKVGFCEMLPHPPTSHDVVFTAMKNFVHLSEKNLSKKFSVLTGDMAIYLIAKLIQMQSPNPFPTLILRIGTFHLQKAWLHCLGQYLDGSGIDSILVDSDIYGENTVHSILNGVQYNRGVRAHKLLYESIKVLQIFEYFNSCDESDINKMLELPSFELLRASIVDRDNIQVRENFSNIIRNSQWFFEKFMTFLEQRSQESETFLFFHRYCEMVEILFDSIRADREGNFDLHLTSTRRMLPYFCSMNHYLYVRGVSLYLNDMLQLPNNVLVDLKRGMMSVKRKKSIFNGVGCDLALEQSQNRSSAISGGLIGITQNDHAMQKWILLYPIKNSMHQSLLEFCDLYDDPTNDIHAFKHNDWKLSQIKKDDEDVDSIMSNLVSKKIFESTPDNVNLYNISNGKIASKEISEYLLTLKENGEKILQIFIKERFIDKVKSVFDRIPRVAVKNFQFGEKSRPKKEKSKEFNETQELVGIQQLLMLCMQRNLKVDMLAKHELLEYPKALADADGFYKKSVKSVLIEEIEKKTLCTINSNHLSSANEEIHLFDGMSIIHRLQLSKFETFGEYAKVFFKYIVSYFKKPNIKRIDVIFDRYDNISIKHLEATLRTVNLTTSEILIQGPETKIPKGSKTFLTSSKNKLELVRFLCKNSLQYVSIPDNRELIISGGFDNLSECYRIRDGVITVVPELFSNHLEADSRIFCHAVYRIPSNAEIIIHTVDTDVFILSIYFWSQFKSLGCSGVWMEVKTSQKSRILACHIAAESLSSSICEILPALHAFTGCDTTSKIATKKKALNIMDIEENRDALIPLGNGLQLSSDQLKALEKLYLNLLDKKGETADEARSNIFSRSYGANVNLGKIPCTSDALHLHALRASAQTYVWKNSIFAQYKMLDFTQFGYKLFNDTLLPVFIRASPLPEDLKKPCNCKGICKTKACYCKKNNVECIPLCACDSKECKN